MHASTRLDSAVSSLAGKPTGRTSRTAQGSTAGCRHQTPSKNQAVAITRRLDYVVTGDLPRPT